MHSICYYEKQPRSWRCVHCVHYVRYVRYVRWPLCYPVLTCSCENAHLPRVLNPRDVILALSSDGKLGGTGARRPSSGRILSGARLLNVNGRNGGKCANERIHEPKPRLSGARPPSGGKLGQSGGRTRESAQTVTDGRDENGRIQHGVKRRLSGGMLLDGSEQCRNDEKLGQSDGMRANAQTRRGEKPARNGETHVNGQKLSGVRPGQSDVIHVNEQSQGDEKLDASIRQSVDANPSNGSAPG